MKYLLILILLTAGFSTTLLAKGSQEKKGNKEFIHYQSKCMKTTQFPLDKSMALCRCVAKGLIKQVSVDSLKQYNAMPEAKTEEQALNMSDGMYNIEQLELMLSQQCLDKSKKPKQ